jgi:hypothetical protein
MVDIYFVEILCGNDAADFLISCGDLIMLSVILLWLKIELGPKKKLCVFTVTCQKNLGSIGRH